ncbi:MAG: plastocyanin/azurin family copper-binding protein [Candidatus Thermoplasmatota archaeon]
MRRLLALLLITATLAGCASSSGPADGYLTPKQDAQGRYVIDLTADNKVAPVKAQVPVGATVVWTVGSGGIHDVTSDPDSAEAFSSDAQYPGKMKGGNQYEHTFTKPGTSTYRCVLHGEMMKASLRVV